MKKLSCLLLVLVSVHFDKAQNGVDRQIVHTSVGETSATAPCKKIGRLAALTKRLPTMLNIIQK